MVVALGCETGGLVVVVVVVALGCGMGGVVVVVTIVGSLVGGGVGEGCSTGASVGGDGGFVGPAAVTCNSAQFQKRSGVPSPPSASFTLQYERAL